MGMILVEFGTFKLLLSISQILLLEKSVCPGNQVWENAESRNKLQPKEWIPKKIALEKVTPSNIMAVLVFFWGWDII